MRKARKSLSVARSQFYDLDAGVPEVEKMKWSSQEEEAKHGRHLDPAVMDIYEVQLKKGWRNDICSNAHLNIAYSADIAIHRARPLSGRDKS
jgi:hypothetical protein